MKLSFTEEFESYIQAGFPLIIIDTVEVDRATEAIKKATEELNKKLKDTQADSYLIEHGYNVMVWDVLNGWYNKDSKIEDAREPEKGLAYVKDENTKSGIYIMENFHLFWNDPYRMPTLIQLLRDIVKHGKSEYKHLFLIGASATLPTEIRDLAVVLDFELPNTEIINNYVKEYTEKLELKFNKKTILSASQAALGMTLNEIESALSVAIVSSKGETIDRNVIFNEKTKSVKRSGLLEYLPSDEGVEVVGGLPNLKLWLDKISRAYKDKEKALKYRLPMPKGCLVTGIAGTGKTLIAKCISNLFEVPLYRWDIGRVFDSLVGGTEKNMREVEKLIEALAPCCVLIDEMEKVMAGLESSGRSDSGVTSRLIGSFLYFMQEKTSSSYIIATCNEPQTLPAPMLRAGRWDALWWVDLPTMEERFEILNIHLKKVGRDPKNFKELKSLSIMADGYTGAEIENSIKMAMFDAFYEDREFNTEDISKAMSKIAPISKTKEEDIKNMRKWAKDRTTPANTGAGKLKATETGKGKGRKIVIHN